MFNIQEADNINHIVVFMTGQTPFPDGLGGAGRIILNAVMILLACYTPDIYADRDIFFTFPFVC